MEFNVRLSSNAKKQYKELQKDKNSKRILQEVEKMLKFVSNNPKNMDEARKNGWDPEKLNNNTYSFRITRGDRFTFRVDENTGEVIVLGVKGHYSGTIFYSMSALMGDVTNNSGFEMLYNKILQFDNMEISFSELMEVGHKYLLSIELINEELLKNLETAKKLKERLENSLLLPSDIDVFSCIINDTIIFIQNDFENLKDNNKNNWRYL